MTQLISIVNYLNNLLPPAAFQDSALNGLQVESPRSDIRKVAFAVDAGLSVIEEAAAQDANLLVVHHGIFWGQEQALTGPFGKKIELLLRSRLSLYASHLPLDAHPEVGNAFELARYLELKQIESYFDYKGAHIGAKGILAKAKPLENLVERLSTIPGASLPLVLPFGRNDIESIGVLTGSGAFGLDACVRDGLDLFVSGEPKQEAYHRAKENKINAIFAGHYATETFGVRALSQRMQRDFDLETCFIDEPTGI